MAERTRNQLLTLLNTQIRDTGNTTFTAAEKEEALREAINDPSVFTIERDDSLTTVASQARYTKPDGFGTITHLFIDVNDDGYGHIVDKGAYTVIGQDIIFEPAYKGLTAGKTIILWGKKQLTETDLIPDYLQDYVLHRAKANLFSMLTSILGTRFLKNDMTMAELRTKIAFHENEAERLKRALPNQQPVIL